MVSGIRKGVLSSTHK